MAYYQSILKIMKTGNFKSKRQTKTAIIGIIVAIVSITLAASCKKDESVVSSDTSEPFTNPQYNLSQAISDEAQQNTICFDGLAFLTGTIGSQSFLPPGKVADYSGFQYFRDNDPTKLGHNTSFVTINSEK